MNRYLLLALILMLSPFSFAQLMSRSGGGKVTKIAITTSNYTGADYTSFSKGGQGYGFEAAVDAGNKWARYFFKAGVDYAQGTQNFQKNTTPNPTIYSSKYEYISIAPEAGVMLFPVARRDSGLNIYIFGSGQISYNYLNVLNIPNTLTGVDSKTQQFGLGYGGGVGLELMLNSSGGGSTRESRGGSSSNHDMIYAEVGFMKSSAQLGGQSNFDTSHIKGSIGYGF